MGPLGGTLIRLYAQECNDLEENRDGVHGPRLEVANWEDFGMVRMSTTVEFEFSALILRRTFF